MRAPLQSSGGDVPQLASLTLAGNNADIIGDALRSVVDHVDLCVVIDTRQLAIDGTLEVAEMVAGDKLRVFRKPWRDDFGYMRTAALDCAARLRAEWALWVDTDERIMAEPGKVRELIEAGGDLVDAISCWHVSGEYAKERLIRLPRRGKYHGRTHEFWDPENLEDRRIGKSQGAVRFDELAKTPEQLTAKLERDLQLLQAQIDEEPDEPRWPYYMGDAYTLLGDKDAALDGFMRAMTTSLGWGELRGWAAFRAANLMIEEGHPDAGLQVACQGMALCPYPELLWTAAAASFVAEDYPNAVMWSMLCISAGSYKGWGKTIERSGHVFPPALFESPFDILSRSYAAMGDQRLAEATRNEYESAKALREAA